MTVYILRDDYECRADDGCSICVIMGVFTTLDLAKKALELLPTPRTDKFLTGIDEEMVLVDKSEKHKSFESTKTREYNKYVIMPMVTNFLKVTED